MKPLSYTLEQTNALRSLRAEFVERCRRNSLYSLRAYARGLGISHTVLSLVLSQKRVPSPALIRVVQEKLPDQGVPDHRDIGAERFARIASWVHYAILGLLTFPDFRKSPAWMAKQLNISSLQARLAFEDLETTGMVARLEGGWRQVVPPIMVKNEHSTQATRKFVRSLLTKADECLDTVPFDTRDLTAITFPMAVSDVKAAKGKIRRFRRTLCQELEERSDHTAVYCLAIQLFPLSRKETKNETGVDVGNVRRTGVKRGDDQSESRE